MWKPYILSKSLKSVTDGEILVYIDSGCAIVRSDWLFHNLKRFQNSDKELLVFKMGDDDRNEKQWTSQKVLDFFEMQEEELGGQIHATFFFLKKSKFTEGLVEQWLKIATTYPELFTDTYGDAHRHDQSIWSCLIKKNKHKGVSFQEDVIETWPNSTGIYKAHAHGEESCLISYTLKYTDIFDVFQFNKFGLQRHWEQFGKRENRVLCSCYDKVSTYINNHGQN
jgi:hypothetical protein